MVTHMQPDKQARKLSPERVYIYIFFTKVGKVPLRLFFKEAKNYFCLLLTTSGDTEGIETPSKHQLELKVLFNPL